MIGKILAHYEIVSKLGEGGMGAVYLARDTKLGREVALKILPEHFANDSERLARFHREARTLAALNHPNIAAIHGLESDQGLNFLAMELAEGEDLSDIIARGPIPVDKAMKIVRDIAQGLEEAHLNGIIHRDLKPANVKVSADGKVKVLDFGLARAFQGESTSEESNLDSPTITGLMTGIGVVLGTAAYMSPEQARGNPVDRRSDIFSFGAVLYEMLTGKRLFHGETISDTLAGILKTDPDWDALPENTPDTVRLLLARCLERDRQQRLQDIGEARILLSGDGLNSLYSSLSLTKMGEDDLYPAPKTRRPLVAFAVAGLLLGAVAGGFLIRSLTPETPPLPLRRLEVALPLQSVDLATKPQISPDGSMAVYVMGNRLWLRRFDTGSTLELSGTEGGDYPFWSPDSRQIGFFIKSKTMRIAVDAGAPQMVCDSSGTGTGAGGTWTEDDRILFTVGDEQGVLQVPARGGTPSSYMPPDTTTVQDIHDPHILTGDRGLLYSAHMKNASFTQLFHYQDGQHHFVFDGGEDRVRNPIYCESGHILFRLDGANNGIWAIPYDAVKKQVLGDSFLVEGNSNWPSVSADHSLLCASGANIQKWKLVSCDRSGKVTGSYGEAQEFAPFFGLDPQGKRMVLSVRDDEGSQLWMLDLERGTQSRLTFDDKTYTAPTWTDDGMFIISAGGVEGNVQAYNLVKISAEGLVSPRILTKGHFPALTPDGKSIVFTLYRQGTGWDLASKDLADLEGADQAVNQEGELQEIAAGPRWQYGGNVSPDGGWVAYVSRETGRDEVYIRRYPEGDQKRQISVNSGGWPMWNATGDRLYFMSELDLVEVEIETEPFLRIGSLNTLFTRPRGEDQFGVGWPLYFQVSGDGETFYMLYGANLDQGNRPLTFVQNWVGEFLED